MEQVATFRSDEESAATAALRMKCADDLSAIVFRGVVNDYIRSQVGNWNGVDFLQGSVEKYDEKLERIGHGLTSQVMAIIFGESQNEAETEASVSIESEIKKTMTTAIAKNFGLMKEMYLEELQGKLNWVMTSVRSEFEEAMVSRCKEAIAAYEAKLTQLDLQKDRFKCDFNIAQSNYYRLEFVNRNQAERLVAMARTECGLKARIAALEERLDQEGVQRKRDADAKINKLLSLLVEKDEDIQQLQSENERMTRELKEHEEAREKIEEEIQKLKALANKAETSLSTASPNSSGYISGVEDSAEDEDDEVEIDQPLRKRPRQESETQSRSNLSFARSALSNSRQSLLEAGLKVHSTCAAIKEKANGVVDRLEDSCVIT